MSTSSSGSTVSTISKVDERGAQKKEANEVVYAETTEGQPLVIRCAARGARPQANVTWYYYYKDQQDDGDNGEDFGGARNEPNVRAEPSSKHGSPVVLGNSHQNGSSTSRTPSDYLISEQRRVEGGAEIIGPVEIAQHTEYQVSRDYNRGILTVYNGNKTKEKKTNEKKKRVTGKKYKICIYLVRYI